jgi:malate dehydrogenase (oxaloacetate-decarboxylating)(NADP+)
MVCVGVCALTLMQDAGSLGKRLDDWAATVGPVGMVVATDGERILGLGDLGVWGAGIPIGKLNLYVALAGVNPRQTLPVVFDAGTNNAELRDHPLYGGLRQARTSGDAYDALIDEFIRELKKRFPNALLQFEDFGAHNAFRLLEKYQGVLPTFNDDIQGTAAVTLAGLLRAFPDGLVGKRFLFLGAGQAGLGISDLIVEHLQVQCESECGVCLSVCLSVCVSVCLFIALSVCLSACAVLVLFIHSHCCLDNMSATEAMRQCWLIDAHGLLHAGRLSELPQRKWRYAHELQTDEEKSWAGMNLEQLVLSIKPHALIGVSGTPKMFTEAVVKAMAAVHERPVIFALSNPTSKSECSAEEAYRWSSARAVFATGSPFPAYTVEEGIGAADGMVGKVLETGQANNCFIFPGVGLAVVTSGARSVTQSMMLAAAKALAAAVPDERIARGSLYPTMTDGRRVSAAVAAAVAVEAERLGLTAVTLPAGVTWERFVEGIMYDPAWFYQPEVAPPQMHEEL